MWNAWKAKIGQLAGTWTLVAQLEHGDEARLQITDGDASLKLPKSEIPWTAGDQLGSHLLPERSGGMLPALYLWRRLAVEGLATFGALDYYGTAPLPGREGLADVLIGSRKGVECRFYFDPAAGHLLALEMFPDEDADPCEIYFSEYREQGGHFWPGRIEVRFGDDRIALFQVKEARCEK